jgi:hypothetical protein
VILGCQEWQDSPKKRERLGSPKQWKRQEWLKRPNQGKRPAPQFRAPRLALRVPQVPRVPRQPPRHRTRQRQCQAPAQTRDASRRPMPAERREGRQPLRRLRHSAGESGSWEDPSSRRTRGGSTPISLLFGKLASNAETAERSAESSPPRGGGDGRTDSAPRAKAPRLCVEEWSE